jgi:transglutaminase-like putative cysteine protease
VKYTVLHRTTYEYESPVLHGRHVIRQRPRPLPFQTVASSVLRVDPRPVWSRQATDYFGNLVDYIEVIEPHDRLEVDTVSVVSVGRRPVDEGLPLFRQTWEAARDRIAADTQLFDAREMCLDSPLVKRQEALVAFAKEAFEPGRGLLEAVIAFNETMHEEFTYDPHVTDVATPIDVVLKERRGVCQDFAHVAVGALRSLGLAARYVSGYLETLPPPGKPRLVGADASHAWASVLVPDYGWVSFDPTNGVLPGERHVVAAWGRDYSDVSPLRGVVLGGGRHTLAVGVDVAPEKPVTVAQGQVQSLARGWEST